MPDDFESTTGLIISDLGLDPDSACFIQDPVEETRGEESPCLVLEAPGARSKASRREWIASLKPLARARLAKGGCLLVRCGAPPGAAEMASFRNALWPAAFHVPAVYIFRERGACCRLDAGGIHPMEHARHPSSTGYVLAVVRREDALSPEAVTEKFDRNAGGWNGDPRSPLYGHFRWMRRIMAEAARPLDGRSVLDAGCGAGWVGIEAAEMGARVSAFDPSPEMTRIAGENAAALGVPLELKVGFGERPPFDGPFDTVITSGVISFSPDQEAFLDGMDSMLRSGGLLVLGDVNPCSLGMRYRRRRHPVLPLRELNALGRRKIIEMLKRRGYRIEKKGYYQLTLPVPVLMHLSESKLRGLGASMLLLLNKAASAADAAAGSWAGALFDSYWIRARKPALPVD